MGITIGKMSGKLSFFFIWGTKTHLYKLIFHTHIEEDRTQVVCLKKNLFDQEKCEKIKI